MIHISPSPKSYIYVMSAWGLWSVCTFCPQMKMDERCYMLELVWKHVNWVSEEVSVEGMLNEAYWKNFYIFLADLCLQKLLRGWGWITIKPAILLHTSHRWHHMAWFLEYVNTKKKTDINLENCYHARVTWWWWLWWSYDDCFWNILINSQDGFCWCGTV